MGAGQSRFLAPMPYSCYEVGHTWERSCTRSTVDVGWTSLYASAKIYASVYAFSALLRGRLPKGKEWLTLLANIAQSTLFLCYNTFGFVTAFCTVRYVLGFLNFYTVGFVPAWLCSYLAVQMERPSRRPLLAIYCSNIATESLITSGQAWGLLPSVSHAEVVTFATTAGILMYLYKGLDFQEAQVNGPKHPDDHFSSENKKATGSDFMFTILRVIVGTPESKITKETNFEDEEDAKEITSYCEKILRCYWSRSLSAVKNIFVGKSSVCCPHKNATCRAHIFEGVVGPFLLGSFINTALALFKRIRSKKQAHIFQWGSTFDLGIFLGLFGGLYKLSSCLHRHIFEKDSKVASGLSGFVAGLSSWIYPSKSMAVYSAWKTAEILTCLGVSSGFLSKIPQFVELLYATSTAVLFHLSITDPKSLKPSYLAFMNQITGNKVNEINRFLIDHDYGTSASALFTSPPFFGPKYHTQRFMDVWGGILDSVQARKR